MALNLQQEAPINRFVSLMQNQEQLLNTTQHAIKVAYTMYFGSMILNSSHLVQITP